MFKPQVSHNQNPNSQSYMVAAVFYHRGFDDSSCDIFSCFPEEIRDEIAALKVGEVKDFKIRSKEGRREARSRANSSDLAVVNTVQGDLMLVGIGEFFPTHFRLPLLVGVPF